MLVHGPRRVHEIAPRWNSSIVPGVDRTVGRSGCYFRLWVIAASDEGSISEVKFSFLPFDVLAPTDTPDKTRAALFTLLIFTRFAC